MRPFLSRQHSPPPKPTESTLPLAVLGYLRRRQGQRGCGNAVLQLPPQRPARPIPPKGKERLHWIMRCPPKHSRTLYPVELELEKCSPFFNPESSSSVDCLPLCQCHLRLARVLQCQLASPPIQTLPCRKRGTLDSFFWPLTKRHRHLANSLDIPPSLCQTMCVLQTPPLPASPQMPQWSLSFPRRRNVHTAWLHAAVASPTIMQPLHILE